MTKAIGTWVSPTILEQYLECKLQAHFSLDSEIKKLHRPGTAAAVGMVAHKTIELLQRGYEFSASWNYSCEHVKRIMSEAWAPAVPPPPSRWDGYQLTRARIQLRVEADEFGAGKRTDFDSVQLPEPNYVKRTAIEGNASRLGKLPWIEQVLFDPILRLKGIPDLVKEVDGEIIIVDLKSGINQAEPTEKQIRQLHFYAWLVECNTGKRPNSGEVVTANNQVFSIRINREAVEEVIELSKRAHLEFAEQSHRRLLSESATPNEKSCCRCSFKVACAPFLNEVQEGWKSDLVVRGLVVEIGKRDSLSYIDLDLDFPKWKLGRFRVVNHDIPEGIKVGHYISFSGLRIDRTTGHANWSTLFHRW